MTLFSATSTITREFDELDIELNVIDRNDNVPVFINNPTVVTVPPATYVANQSKREWTKLISFQAQDLDLNESGTIEYRLLQCPTWIRLDQTGLLSILNLKVMDESLLAKPIQCQVEAQDKGLIKPQVARVTFDLQQEEGEAASDRAAGSSVQFLPSSSGE